MNTSPKPHVGLRKRLHKYCRIIKYNAVHVTESKIVLGLDLEKNLYLKTNTQDMSSDLQIKTKLWPVTRDQEQDLDNT